MIPKETRTYFEYDVNMISRWRNEQGTHVSIRSSISIWRRDILRIRYTRNATRHRKEMEIKMRSIWKWSFHIFLVHEYHIVDSWGWRISKIFFYFDYDYPYLSSIYVYIYIDQERILRSIDEYIQRIFDVWVSRHDCMNWIVFCFFPFLCKSFLIW